MMDAETFLKEALIKALSDLSIEVDLTIALEHPADLSHGDYASNVALQAAGKMKANPREIAQKIVDSLSHQEALKELIKKIEIAGPGFINFTLSSNYFSESLSTIDSEFGKNQKLAGKKAMVEYTDPNPFKVLHIGHLMSNTIGESLSRVIEWSGAETKRACYQGDVGMHVAKSIWGLMEMGLDQLPKDKNLSEQIVYLGKAYSLGSSAYGDDEKNVQEEIKKLNKQIYERSDDQINELYQWGRQISLDYFETQYKKLGTKFDFYFFESKVGGPGMELVKEYLQKGVFEASKGAIVFPGEKYDLHTRVFLNSEGLPTYEAKELGLAQVKYDEYPYDLSIVVTGNEINQYFKVLLKAMSLIYPELQEKTVHVGHGMLRLPEGKMSSRTGSVIAAEDLINQAEAKVKERGSHAKMDISSQVAIAAIKFSILSHSAGSDIVFDMEKSLSYEGDSGPYLQYTYARSQSILRKATEQGLSRSYELPENWETQEFERLLLRLPEVVELSLQNYSSHFIAMYLLHLTRAFNSWYGNTKIIDQDDPATGYKLALTQSVAQVVKNGLWLLGIKVVEEM